MIMPKRTKPAAAEIPTYIPQPIVVLEESSCGTPQPTIRLRATKGAHRRGFMAFLHQVAAAVELASIPGARGWIVQIAHDSNYTNIPGECGRVYLELGDGTPAEAERGMQTLRDALVGMGVR